MKTLITVTAISLMILSACDNRCVEGGGALADYDLDVSSFDQISVSGPININITQGSTQAVTIQAEPEIYGIMEPRVKNGELIIDFENRSCIQTDLGVTVNVTIPDLKRIEVSGTSMIQSIGNLELDHLTVKVSGTADVSLSGSAISQTYDVSGVLVASNFDFATSDVNVDISGSGNMEVNCANNLDIDVSGSATVKYKGSPKISQKASGTINLVNSN